jgi:hypothetical protein
MAQAGIEWLVQGRRTDELARILLLLQAEMHTENFAVVEACYRQGDTLERQAVLRALALLPKPAIYCSLAIDGCRSHIQPLFESIACENPYPTAYFPDLNFNQMVLKALFMGIELKRVRGWSQRRNPELIRMAEDYKAERRAADRRVPEDLDRLIAFQS